jgi:hypothetical protein
MTDKRTQQHAPQGNMEKDPEDWVTGDEPMTGAQRSYLKTLSEEAHEPFDETLTKAEASRRIDELQARTGRGRTQNHSLGKSLAWRVVGGQRDVHASYWTLDRHQSEREFRSRPRHPDRNRSQRI